MNIFYRLLNKRKLPKIYQPHDMTLIKNLILQAELEGKDMSLMRSLVHSYELDNPQPDVLTIDGD